MMRYAELKDKYDNLAKSELKKNEDILKESFIEYFGEEYRALLEKRFKEIIYIYYVNWQTIYKVTSRESLAKEEKFKPYFEFLEARENMFYSFIHGNIMPDCFIGTSDEYVFDTLSIYDFVLARMKQIDSYSFIHNDMHGSKRLVCFNLFLTDERVLIHELVHSLVGELILKVRDSKRELSVEKIGISIYDDRESLEDVFEELVVDKISGKIYEIFKRRGGDLSSFLSGGIYGGSYALNYYLIDEFFDAFEEELKRVLMTDNKNYLLEKVGKDNYYQYCKLINDNFVSGYPSDSFKKKNINKINLIVNSMMENVKRQEEYSEDDWNQYFAYLRSMGKKVTVLNKKIN